MYNYGQTRSRSGNGITSSAYSLSPHYSHQQHPIEVSHQQTYIPPNFPQNKGTTSDNVYFNIEINNIPFTIDFAQHEFDGTFSLTNYNETLTQPIIQNPSDYYLTVARFIIPGDSIPIVYCPIIGGAAQTDPNLTPFIVTLFFGGMPFVSNVQFFSLTGVSVPNAPSMNQPNFLRTDSPYYYVFSYQHIITMFNNALLASFNALKLAFPAAPPTEAPFFIFDEITQLIRLVVQNSYSEVIAGGPTIEIFMNAVSYFRFFVSFYTQFFGYNQPNGMDFQFIVPPTTVNQIPPPGPATAIRPLFNNAYTYPVLAPAAAPPPQVQQMEQPREYTETLNNPPDYIFLTQEFVSVEYWNTFKSIVFTSATLPLQAEYVPSSIIRNGGQANGVINYRPILTDFTPSLPRAGDLRGIFVYTPQGPYRLISLMGSVPIQKIDLQVYWQDNDDLLHPIVLNPGRFMSVKLLFIRKENDGL
jgi:hypothetical protein